MFASISKLFRKSARGADQSPSGNADGAAGLGADAAAAPEPGPSIALPFSILLKAVPHNLHGKNASAPNPTGNFFMSRSEVLEQLAKGALRIPFGAIRSGAPNGFFTTSASQDETLIDIPLKDVVGQLRQEDLVRHPRARVEVPSDVSDLFGCKGAGLRVMAKQEVSKMVSDTAMRRKAEAAAAAPVAATPAPAHAAPAAAVAAPSAPAAPIAISANLAASLNEAQAAARPAARTTPPTAPAIPPVRPAAVPPVATTLPPANVVPGVTSPARPRIEGSALVVPLNQLCDNWSDAIRQEISNLRLTGSLCHLPLAELGKGVKQGKIELPWKTVRTWLKPLPSGASTHGETIVALPLQVIAPMFVSQQKPAAAPPKADVPENVPDVFSRAGAPAAPALAPPPPAPVAPPPPAPRVRAAAPPPPPPAPAPIPVTAPAPVAAPRPAPAPVRPPAPAPVAAAPRAAAPAPAATRKRESNTERRESNTERRRKSEKIDSSTVSISVSLLAANWPANLVKDIDPKFLTKAKLEIPVQALEAGVRAGKVDFSWSELCSWMQPAAAEELVAAHAETRLGLPLSVVAPLFLQRTPTPQPRKESTLAGDIPDVFDQSGAIIAPPVSESPIIEAPAPPPPPPAPVPAAPAPPRGGTEFTERPKRPIPAKPGAVKDLAELFGQPDKRNWTPNEIVKHTAKLPGVAGALIALQDGLLVASCMPPQWKTETVAAFLPQIFGRMHQYTKELKMGELYSVTMTVEAGALQIFASGIIYFATLSTPDMQLPIHELNVIAHELSRHTK